MANQLWVQSYINYKYRDQIPNLMLYGVLRTCNETLIMNLDFQI